MPSFMFSAGSLNGLEYFLDTDKADDIFLFQFILKNFGQNPLNLNTYCLMAKEEPFKEQLIKITMFLSSMFPYSTDEYTVYFGSQQGKLFSFNDTPLSINAKSLRDCAEFEYNQVTVLRVHDLTQKLVLLSDIQLINSNTVQKFRAFDVGLKNITIDKTDIHHAPPNGLNLSPTVNQTPPQLLQPSHSIITNKSNITDTKTPVPSPAVNTSPDVASHFVTPTSKRKAKEIRDEVEHTDKSGSNTPEQEIPSDGAGKLAGLGITKSPPSEGNNQVQTVFIDGGTKFKKQLKEKKDQNKKAAKKSPNYSIRFRTPLVNELSLKESTPRR